MKPASEIRFRVVELLANNRHRTIDSDLELGTARSSLDLCKRLDPDRKVIIEPVEALVNDRADYVQSEIAGEIAPRLAVVK